jgi:hypothetical protein
MSPMARHAANRDGQNVYRSRLGTRVPIWQWSVGVNTERRTAILSFLMGGVIGWSLFGAILIAAPAQWVAPAFLISLASVSVQYIAWWRLGGHVTLLWPHPLRQMARSLGIPDLVVLAPVYLGGLWLISAAIVRWSRGAAPLMADRHWALTAGRVAFVIALIPFLIFAFRDRFWRYEWLGRGRRAQLSRAFSWASLDPWLHQIFVCFGTVCAFAFAFARLG